MVELPLDPLLAVRIDSPVTGDDGTSSVGRALAHGEHRIVVLVADLELRPSGVEVVPGLAGEIDDSVLRLIEGVAEEDGLQEILVSDEVVLGEPDHDGLALGARAVAFEDDHELDGVVEALDGLGGGIGGERTLVGGVDLGLLEDRGEGLLHLGPGGSERWRASVVAHGPVVLAHDVPGVVPLAVGGKRGMKETDLASHWRASGGCGGGGGHLVCGQ